MEATAPRVVTTPVFDTPIPNGSGPKESTGFFGTIKSFFGRVFGAVKNAASRAFGWLKSTFSNVINRIPERVQRLGKPFALLPLAAPKVWGWIGKAATWLYNHGPRQIQNFLGRYVWQPMTAIFERQAAKQERSWLRTLIRLTPAIIQWTIFRVAHTLLRRLGWVGWTASIALTLLATPVLKYLGDFTDGNQLGQTIMAGTSLATVAVLFVGALFGKNLSVLKGLDFLVLKAAPVGGLLQEAVLDTIRDEMDEAEQAADTSDEVVDAVVVSNEEMAERVADEMRKDPANAVTLVQSKKNPHPKGRREVWVVKGHDVDVDEVSGFYWQDGVGYDADGQAIAVDLRGDLTRATRDRRRQEFVDFWTKAHSAA